MNSLGRRLIVATGVLGVVLASAMPAAAQHGGGGHAGGGGHSFGGHVGGVAHASAGHFSGGAHFAPAAHFAPSGSVGHAYAAGGHAFAGGAYGGRAAYGYPGGGYARGYSTGAYWGGGYWHGGYWPRAYYGFGFSWFLPVLPLAYATYWYSGVPYYYANDVYYTWNPDYSGYTATDPPPIAEGQGAGTDGSAVAPQQGYSSPGPGTPDSGGGQIFMYPKNGQSEAQQSIDRRECQQWAASQAGQGAANGMDYRRAMLACVEGRGYSAN